MSDPIVQVEGLGKKFIITHEAGSQYAKRYMTLRESLAAWPGQMLRKFTHPLDATLGKGEREEFWALRDVNFQIAHGESIGVIGRNGAGKSTLLKLLSRISAPTEGRFTLRGRVASLLEVGTGFHPELTGRENIFLNGAILGMSRAEVRRQFDDIVAFADVERFLDTPVKRFSSGMYTRLAFAIAAHLQPDILIMDEVLAVGDAQFQKKCLSKMEDVSTQQGRTIIFVSHSMGLISRVCQRCLVLRQGKLIYDGDTPGAMALYMEELRSSPGCYTAKSFKPDMAQILRVALVDDKGELIVNDHTNRSEFRLQVDVHTPLRIPAGSILFTLREASGTIVMSVDMRDTSSDGIPAGTHRFEVPFPPFLLAPGTFTFSLALSALHHIHHVETIPDAVSIGIVDIDSMHGNNRTGYFGGRLPFHNVGPVDPSTIFGIGAKAEPTVVTSGA